MSFLVLTVSHHQQELGEYLVPEQYRDQGCIVLINQADVATVALDSKSHCGGYEVVLSEQAEAPERVLQTREGNRGSHDSTMILPSKGVAGSRRDTDRDEETAERTDRTCGDSEASDGPSDDGLSVEIYPVIPGYLLQGVIGRGGMGTVWRAHQVSTNRQVAVKTILPSILNRPKSSIRFQREVELAANLKHPGIATVYDSGASQGHHYYSMEYIDGEPWGQYVRRHQSSRQVIIKQLCQVLDAISHAHENSVIHRDLKPSNILIDRTGNAIVVDFGLAKQKTSADSDDELSRQGDVLGTFAFMSPEQASGQVQETDARTDIYALGAVALYLLGAYSGAKFKLHARKKVDDESKGILEEAAEKGLTDDPELQQVILKSVHPDREDRFQSAAEFRDAAAEYLASQDEKSGTGRGNRLLKMGMLAIACVAVFGIAGYWIKSSRDSTKLNALADMEGAEEVDPESLLTVEERVELMFGGLFPAPFPGVDEVRHGLFQTSGVGGKKKVDYTIIHPESWPLVGFNFCTATYNRDGIIKVLQPIFRDPDSDKLATGKMLGKLNLDCKFNREVAKPGYVIAGVHARGGARLHAIKIIYCRLADEGLDPMDRYESPWYGGNGKSGPDGVLLGDNGGVVRGVKCAFDVDINKLALLYD